MCMCVCVRACVCVCKRQDPPAADHGAVDSSGTTGRRRLAVTSLECFYNLHNGNGNEECLKAWESVHLAQWEWEDLALWE